MHELYPSKEEALDAARTGAADAVLETFWQLAELFVTLGASVDGVRDEAMLESALGKPLNLFAYGTPSLFDLAASYGYGIVKNHPFIDGNKRTGFIAAVVFLELNGYHFWASEVDAALKTFALAAGELSEAAFAEWLKLNSKREQAIPMVCVSHTS